MAYNYFWTQHTGLSERLEFPRSHHHYVFDGRGMKSYGDIGAGFVSRSLWQFFIHKLKCYVLIYEACKIHVNHQNTYMGDLMDTFKSKILNQRKQLVQTNYMNYYKTSSISRTKSHNLNVLSWEWRCSWSSADRRCSNCIWVINNFIAY